MFLAAGDRLDERHEARLAWLDAFVFVVADVVVQSGVLFALNIYPAATRSA